MNDVQLQNLRKRQFMLVNVWMGILLALTIMALEFNQVILFLVVIWVIYLAVTLFRKTKGYKEPLVLFPSLKPLMEYERKSGNVPQNNLPGFLIAYSAQLLLLRGDVVNSAELIIIFLAIIIVVDIVLLHRIRKGSTNLPSPKPQAQGLTLRGYLFMLATIIPGTLLSIYGSAYYSQYQMDEYWQDSYGMFIPTNSTFVVLLLLICTISFFGMSFSKVFYPKKLGNKGTLYFKICSLVFICSLAITSSVMYFTFNDFKYVTSNGVYYHSAVTKQQRYYVWEDIKNVSGGLGYSKGWNFQYVLTFNDGKQLNIAEGYGAQTSLEALKEVNKILTEKHIPFTMSKISEEKYTKMRNDFNWDAAKIDDINTIFHTK